MIMEAQTSRHLPPAGRSPLPTCLPGQERTESYCSVSQAAWTEPSTAQHPEPMRFHGRHTSRDLHEGTRTISAPVGPLQHVRGPCLDSLFSPHPSQAHCTRAPVLWQPHLAQTSLIPAVCELGTRGNPAFQGTLGVASRESSLLFRLERGPGIALQAMQEKKALSSRSPASSVLAREGAGCGSVGDVPGAWLASAPLWPSLWT